MAAHECQRKNNARNRYQSRAHTLTYRVSPKQKKSKWYLSIFPITNHTFSVPKAMLIWFIITNV